MPSVLYRSAFLCYFYFIFFYFQNYYFDSIHNQVTHTHTHTHTHKRTHTSQCHYSHACLALLCTICYYESAMCWIGGNLSENPTSNSFPKQNSRKFNKNWFEYFEIPINEKKIGNANIYSWMLTPIHANSECKKLSAYTNTLAYIFENSWSNF